MAGPYSKRLQVSMASLYGEAAHHFGLVTSAQAAAAGVSQDVVDRRVRSGGWTCVHMGVYRLPGVPASWHGDVLAACLATGPTSVASHRTAAALHGLSRAGSADPVEICAVGSALPLLQGVEVHRTRRLDTCDRTELDGIPVTSAARTLIDLARVLDRHDLTALVDEAVCAGVIGRTWLYRRAQTLRVGRPGVQHLLTLAAPGAESAFRSWLERHTAAVFRAHGVPQPEWNVALYDRAGRIGIVDGLWRPARTVLELEGLRFHTTPAQRRKDASRFNRFMLSGHAALRFTWEDVVRDPRRVVDQVRAALQRARVDLTAS